MGRVRLSDRVATYVAASIVQSVGKNLDDVVLTRSSIRRARMTTRKEVAADIAGFVAHETLLLLWDGKLLPDIPGGSHIIRSAIAEWLAVRSKDLRVPCSNPSNAGFFRGPLWAYPSLPCSIPSGWRTRRHAQCALDGEGDLLPQDRPPGGSVPVDGPGEEPSHAHRGRRSPTRASGTRRRCPNALRPTTAASCRASTCTPMKESGMPRTRRSDGTCGSIRRSSSPLPSSTTGCRWTPRSGTSTDPRMPDVTKSLKRLDGSTFDHRAPSTPCQPPFSLNGKEEARGTFLRTKPALVASGPHLYVGFKWKTRALNVVNDTAERGVALIQEYCSSWSPSTERSFPSPRRPSSSVEFEGFQLPASVFTSL
jgi:hypothetical protein